MGWLQDVRFALRLLRRSPGLTLVALAVLALGIGATTAVFSVVDGVLLAPLPVPDGERVAFITREGDVSIPDGVDWRAASRSFEAIALFLRSWAFDLTGEGEPERLSGVVTEPELFDVLRVEPLLGRRLAAADDRPGAAPVVVLAEGFWRRRFGGDPGVLGASLRLSDVAYTVVGVMPATADFLDDGVDLWAPVAAATPWALAERGTNNFDAVGRLAAGATLAEAKADLREISTRLAALYPRTNRNKIVEPMALLDFRVGAVRPALWVLQAAVGLVVLVSCLNLAALLLARGAARRREMATRLSLGAAGGRLARQLLTEGLVLAAAGGTLGILLAFWGRDLLLAAAPAELPRAGAVAMDGRVLALAAATTLLSGLLIGLLPAWRLARADPARWLAGGGRGGSPERSGQRTLAAVVAVEVALACVLLVGAGLLLRSFRHLAHVELGFDPERVLTADLVLPESRYSQRTAQTAAFSAMLDETAALPGVERAAFVIGAPLEPRGGIGHTVLIEGSELAADEMPGARVRPVLGDYFGALGQPIVAGRAFTSADDESAPPVAIVNRQFARQFWPGRSPLGARIAFRLGDTEPTWMTIVGVTADLKSTTLDADDTRAVYYPYRQRLPDWQRFGTLVLRTAGDPAALARPLHEAVWRVDPTLPLTGVTTLEAKLRRALARARFTAVALAAFAATALLLAVLGVYGALAWSVERRRREIGVRMALGALRRDLVRGVVARALALAAAGLVLGLLTAAAVARGLRALLYQVAPTDAAVYALAALVLFAVTALGAGLPARRASRVDPVEALRGE